MIETNLRTTSPGIDCQQMAERYQGVRRASRTICEPLEPEDCCIQSMPDVSPTKWHLAHTSWFFETFLLKPSLRGFQSVNPKFEYLFNSYYNSVGKQFARSERGNLSRPTLVEVMSYREQVDEAMGELLATECSRELLSLAELGIQHEQQHQELMLMDIKHVFSCNPLRPTYRDSQGSEGEADVAPLNWLDFDAATHSIGHDGAGFAFDNESPRHRVFVESFAIADRLITCGEYLEFIEDNGYERPELWLSEGWRVIQERNWTAPLYWEFVDNRWRIMTLSGMCDLDPTEPVCHVSYYEADAFARWKRCWLPRETFWEIVADPLEIEGNFIEAMHFHPIAQSSSCKSPSPAQMFGDVWEWTSSPYVAYHGYRANDNALGEYNGKFMSNQMVLRGGSCVTPRSHIRASYRNFFPPDARWPFTGIRLANEV